MAYRRDSGALERERERLAHQVRTLEQRWTETFWREVAPKQGIAARDSRPRAGEPEAEVAQLAARLEELNALEPKVTKILVWWKSPLPLPEPGPPERPKLLGKALREQLEAGFEHFCRQVAEAAGTTPIVVRAVYAQARYEGVFITGHLMTTTAPGVAELVVRNETFGDDLRKLFGSKHDIRIGDENFDGIFAVEGDETLARQVLDSEIRAALVTMGAQKRVAVRCGAGHVEVGRFAINEYGGPDLRWIRSAVAVTRALRDAPVRPLRT